MLLSVIIVNWNVRPLLQRALTSVFASWGTRPGLEVIVVDNASTDGSPAMVAAEFPQVKLIVSSENRGFTGGNNLGLAHATGEFQLLLNPDTEVLDDALPRLVAYAQAHPDVGVIGPQLLNADGTVQASRRRFPTLDVLFTESTWLQALAPRAALAAYYVEDRPDNVEQAVDWVTGAALLVRREAIAQVGPLDEGFFMYSEELDWCHRFRDAGWRVVYWPEARIIHHEGKSSEQVVPARHIYFQSSKVYYTRKYHGHGAAALLRAWLLLQYEWQMALEAAKWLVGHRRPLRAERIAAYRQVIASGLRGSGKK